MKYGIALTFPAGSRGSDADLIWGEIGLAMLIDALGFESIFVFEHHFSDYMVSPAPLTTLSYLAGVTSGANLGTSAIVLPLCNAVRVSEEVNLLTLLSGGRGIYGFAMGRSPREFVGLARDFSTRESAFWSSLDTVLAGCVAQASPAASAHSRFTVRPRGDHSLGSFHGVTSTDHGLTRLGGMGLGAMLQYSGDLQETRASVFRYREAVRAAGRSGFVTLFVTALVSVTLERARQLAVVCHRADTQAAAAHYGEHGDSIHSNASLPMQAVEPVSASEHVRSGFVYGDYQSFREQINHLAERVAPDRLVFEVSYAGADLTTSRDTVLGIARALL